ncbi:long-chain fatty acid--CoA ligase [Nocardioides sp. GY 10113]|uniref:class I adenylate-forming enzyme family protein n=1 Tax=Nocardioides sp. GY 10113 TaxID=2569761 RepID=UPI0010A79F9C|nr:AMP-binding protein [Nocardioides sp. GY 10113]TIC89249.1 long-chain fatty acid--CoA ligase [Nocardioides sp. GY 10113]
MPPTVLPEPGADVAELLSAAAADLPQRLAVIEAGGRGVTWGQLDEEVSRLATGLGEAGIVAGHRVMIALGNRLEFVAGYLAVLRAQAVAVPVNPGSTEAELAWLIPDSGARLVLADQESIDAVRAAIRGGAGERVGVVVVDVPPRPGERAYQDLCSATPSPVPPLPDPERLAVLLYTSGASGRPRAAMLSHRALLANVEQVAAVSPPMINSDDVVLGLVPLFHVYGLNAVLGGVLRHRAKLVLTDRFDPEGTLDLIEDEACSVVPVAPPVFAHWIGVDGLAERLGPVRLVLSGSAPLSAETIEDFQAGARVPVHQGYGLTEAAPVVTTTLHSGQPKIGSVGSALGGIELRLVDEYGEPRSAADADDPGEIQIRGANLFSGYWPDGADGPGEGGWWSTGDVGFLDAEGDLYLVDRIKDLVIVSGFNVYPIEVEQVIAEVAGVRAVAVVGVPDAGTGEAVVAYVVPTPEVAPDGAADLVAAVQRRCQEQLAGFKRPARVEVVETLPRTVTGKIRKGVLRGIARRRAGGLIR